MKKIIAIISLCSAILTLTGCEKEENGNKPPLSSGLIASNNSSSAGTSSVHSPESSSSGSPGSADVPSPFEPVYSEPTSEPPLSFPNLPTVDDPTEIYGIHDLSNGNYIYNPNVTDTTNTQRYYADFSWSDDPKVLWTSSIDEVPWPSYDRDAAVAYGHAHWDDGVGLCAPFISRCITAGNITNYTDSSTSITLQLLHSRLGFGQFLAYNKYDHTITLPEYARPGDVIQIYCSYEGMMIHSLLMVGTDDEGKLKVVCHNMRNGGFTTFYVDHWNDPCYDCESETVEVFFYHFYCDEDEGLPEAVVNNKDVLLWEERAYTIPGEKYDREAALEYARRYPEDGIGYYGAVHTWSILEAGGLSVGYSNQSALFLQLLKSHLGTAYSQKIREDRTVILPQYAKPGDIGFVYCPYDGMITSSFIIAGSDDTGRMITESYDLLNDGESAFKVESYCVGCGEDLKEVVIYCFDDT